MSCDFGMAVFLRIALSLQAFKYDSCCSDKLEKGRAGKSQPYTSISVKLQKISDIVICGHNDSAPTARLLGPQSILINGRGEFNCSNSCPGRADLQFI